MDPRQLEIVEKVNRNQRVVDHAYPDSVTSQEPPLLPDVPKSEPGAKEQQRVEKHDAVKKKTAVLAS